MIVAFSGLRPGDKFRWRGKRFVKVYGFGEANCGEVDTHCFAKIPWDAMVEVPPFDTDENYTPTPDEIREQEETEKEKGRMLDRIMRGEFDNPLDKEC